MPLPWLACSATVRWTGINETVILLDLQRGTYLAMDPVASTMWRLILRERSRRDVIDTLSRLYGESAVRLATDLDRFVDRCSKDGLLTDPHCREPERVQPRMEHRRRSVSLWHAWSCMAKVAWLLHRGGFPLGYKAITGLAERCPRQPASSQVVDRALQSFLAAENFFVFRSAPDDCLVRTLALFLFLRRLAVPAQHCIGVRTEPVFAAHAWVEIAGQTLLEATDNGAPFSVLAKA